MKRIKMLLFGLLCLLIMPFSVNAASAKVSVSAPSSVVVGNTITVTVTLSGSKIGAWEMDLNYNDDYLRLTSTTSEGGGTSMQGFSTKESGVSKKTYTFKFKALKSGTTKISVPSYYVLNMDEEELSVTSSSDSVKIMTQSELEATYSTDAYLKSLSVGSYDLNPTFKKDVYEYNVEVENDVTSVKISASVNDSKSEMEGTGEYQLEEGSNSFEIVVTAQRGNQSTYKIIVNRKELDPINVYVEDEDKNYTMVRKEENLPELQTYSLVTLNYEDYEVPALKSDITGYELVGLKDDTGKVFMYLIENGVVKTKYIEVNNVMMSLYPQEFIMADVFKDYEKHTEVINEREISGYKFNKDSNNFIFYAHNILTGDYNYYVYDLENETISVFNNEVEEYYKELIEKYKYVVLGTLGFVIILLFILIIRRPKKIIINAPTKKEEKDLKELIEKHIEEEIESELENTKSIKPINKEILEEKDNKKSKKKKSNKESDLEKTKEVKTVNSNKEEKEEELVKTKKIDLSKLDEVDINDVKEIEKTQQLVAVKEVSAMSKREQEKLLKQQKKLLKQEKKREKARREFDF